MINAIHLTSLTISDLKRSIVFYEDILGMKSLLNPGQVGMQ